MGVLLDPETLTAAFASAREAVSAAFDDTAAASACDDLLVSVVVPTIEAAIVGWEISARSGGIEMSAQRALVRRSGIPAEEPSFAARAVAAGETARIAAIGGTHLYLPLAELTAQTMGRRLDADRPAPASRVDQLAGQPSLLCRLGTAADASRARRSRRAVD